jgi:hypothetical protein
VKPWLIACIVFGALVVSIGFGVLLHHTEVMTQEERARNRAIQEIGAGVCLVLVFAIMLASVVIDCCRARGIGGP